MPLITISPTIISFEFWFVFIVENFCRRLFKSPKKNRRRSQVPDSSPFDDSRDELMYKMQSKEDSPLFQTQLRGPPTLSPCKSPATGLLPLAYPFTVEVSTSFFLLIDECRKGKH